MYSLEMQVYADGDGSFYDEDYSGSVVLNTPSSVSRCDTADDEGMEQRRRCRRGARHGEGEGSVPFPAGTDSTLLV